MEQREGLDDFMQLSKLLNDDEVIVLDRNERRGKEETSTEQ